MKASAARWAKDLTESLLATEIPGVSRRALTAYLEETGFTRALDGLEFTKDGLCAGTLSACLPVLLKLSGGETPEEGWLCAAYDALSYGLYPPEPPISAPSPGVAAAVEFYCRVLSACIARERADRAYDPLTDVLPVTEAERKESHIAEEYGAFIAAVTASRYGELLRLARETQSFDPLSHTAGVHHVAVHMARQAKRAGAPVDVALVCAASFAHDIGKFGCRGADLKRVPYLHYYYTDRWLNARGLTRVARVASNHSTWDLEFDNLPVESLLLIYADFRVRGTRGDGGEQTGIYTLEEAGQVIFGKLADMVPEKRRRYSRVYRKLRDFEEYLLRLGANPDPLLDAPLPRDGMDPALLPPAESVGAVKRMAMDHNIRLMHAFSVNESFERLLERAGSEKNLESIRAYLSLFDEYGSYMTRSHKLLTLRFLYELLMHHESDVRRSAGLLMGRILGNDGLLYRKELPENAPDTAIAPTLSEMLGECESLWRSFLQQLLAPDPKVSRRHATRIVNSLKVVVHSVFRCCKHMDARVYLDPLMERLRADRPEERFVLMDTAVHIPAALFTPQELAELTDFAAPLLLGTDRAEQVCALRALTYLVENRPEAAGPVGALLGQVRSVAPGGAGYLLRRLRGLIGADAADRDAEARGVSELYLSNLRTAEHFIVKIANIDLMAAYAAAHPEEAFHVATHLSNLLMVSEHLPVREHAGEALSAMAGLLSVDQVNEIVIDLSRGLESEQPEFVRYVPPVLSSLLGRLPVLEQDEAVEFLARLMRTGNARAAGAALSALGAALVGLLKAGGPEDSLCRTRQDRILGLLLSGLAHYSGEVHRAALGVLCRDLCGADELPLSMRRDLFCRIVKKLVTILPERTGDEITFLHTGAMLNHLYRMIVDCEVSFGAFSFPPAGPVAFFPGAFDPFSSGHKRIVTEIRGLNMEVYLAVDEFSWSKRTQPKLLRRQIALMSTADCFGVYLFPDELPVNIANPADLSALKKLFPGRQVFLVAGSDVIEHASAYAPSAPPDGARAFDHILFSRSRGEEEDPASPAVPAARERLTGQVIELALSTYYEDVSSSRIRESVDRNIEISMLVDPVVEAYIHKNGLYLRAPQYKQTLSPDRRVLSSLTEADTAMAHVLRGFPHAYAAGLLETLRCGCGRAALVFDGDSVSASGAVHGHTVTAVQLLEALGDYGRAEYVREHAAGRMLLIDGCCVLPGAEDALPELVNELLAGSLNDEHTYGLYISRGERDPLAHALLQKGFLPAPGDGRLLVCDMRAPLVLLLDAFMQLKEPFASDPEVARCIYDTRERLLCALCELFPGSLALAFDTGRINQALIQKAQAYNGVLGLPETPRRLGPFMCVPYGEILSDVVVPNTVTKTLHVEKVFESDVRHFTIREEPGYSPLATQIRTVRSFNRPLLLVDDLMHNGYRMEKLGPLLSEAGVEVHMILTGILSGRGKDLMARQGRRVDAVYTVPNLRYWFTESLLYPFFGGDSVVRAGGGREGGLPSINLILPYRSPDFIHGVTDAAKRALSMAALKNAYELLHTLEERHQALMGRSLTIGRLGEALQKPRLPDKGRSVFYDRSLPASAVLRDDIEWLGRMVQ